jgi:hypothetical protein
MKKSYLQKYESSYNADNSINCFKKNDISCNTCKLQNEAKELSRVNSDYERNCSSVNGSHKKQCTNPLHHHQENKKPTPENHRQYTKSQTCAQNCKHTSHHVKEHDEKCCTVTEKIIRLPICNGDNSNDSKKRPPDCTKPRPPAPPLPPAACPTPPCPSPPTPCPTCPTSCCQSCDIPDIPIKQGVSAMIGSIALIESSLACILNSESAKIDRVLDVSQTPSDYVDINKAVSHAVREIAELEKVLYEKLVIARSFLECDPDKNCVDDKGDANVPEDEVSRSSEECE